MMQHVGNVYKLNYCTGLLGRDTGAVKWLLIILITQRQARIYMLSIYNSYLCSVRPAKRLHCDIKPFDQHSPTTLILRGKKHVDFLQFHLRTHRKKKAQHIRNRFMKANHPSNMTTMYYVACYCLHRLVVPTVHC